MPRLLYYDFSPRVTAFSSTRHGGCGRGCYGDFNVNLYCGDKQEHIVRNREALCQQLGITEDHLVMPHQNHGTQVRQVDNVFLAFSAEERQTALEGVDAVMTDVVSVCVGVSTADCIPVLLYDEEHHAACAVHAGWRGTAKRIVEKAVLEMEQAYDTRAANLRAAIGPGISIDAFEVGDEVYDKFVEAGFSMNRLARRYPAKDRPYKWHIDLPECNRQQLLSVGVKPTDIQLSGICTYTQSDDFFSARKLTVQSGRILTAILLR